MAASLIIAILGAVFTLLFIVMLLQGKKYAELTTPLAEKEFPLKDVYCVGFALLDKIHYPYSGKIYRTLRDNARILYGEKFAVYYARIVLGQCVALCILVLAGGFTFSSLAQPGDQLMMAMLTFVLAGVVVYYFYTRMGNDLLALRRKYVRQFPGIISRMALLLNTGMMLREAWSTVAFSSDDELNMLMRESCNEINNGKSESEAYYLFGILCGEPDIRKFISLIIQNLSKGNADLAIVLSQQSSELWNKRKQQVLRDGELAASKLLIPVGLMFVGVLIIVVVPIISNMGLG